MGGPSTEYEVSLNSGKNVFKAINPAKFISSLAVLSKSLKLKINNQAAKFPEDLKSFDIVFNAMHGQFGEDGQIQAILDKINVPFTGAGAVASSLAMDKWASREVFRKSKIRIPLGKLILAPGEISKINLPAVLKPRNGGSSVGVSIVKSKKELLKKIKETFRYDSEVVVEKYLVGREFTCGVLEIKGKLKALPVIEIRPKEKYEFFDYEAKYKTGATDEIVPAPISVKLSREIQRLALKIHRALKCRVYSRSDFIWHKNKLYTLELNTLPGLTQNSLLPKSARVAGLDFPKLIETIIFSSLRYFKKKASG